MGMAWVIGCGWSSWLHFFLITLLAYSPPHFILETTLKIGYSGYWCVALSSELSDQIFTISPCIVCHTLTK